MKKFLKALDRDGERWAMLVFYTFCCVVIVQEVLRRFVLNYSSAWGEEAARYAFIYLGWIGAAYAVRERAHIRFDIVLQRMGARGKAVVYLFAEIATIVFACFALYWSMHTVRQLLHFGGLAPVLQVNKAWFEAAVPIGFSLVIFRCVQRMRQDFADLRAGRDPFVGKAMFEE